MAVPWSVGELYLIQPSELKWPEQDPYDHWTGGPVGYVVELGFFNLCWNGTYGFLNIQVPGGRFWSKVTQGLGS